MRPSQDVREHDVHAVQEIVPTEVGSLDLLVSHYGVDLKNLDADLGTASREIGVS